ncbi:amphoterin-induced protein 1-like [Synchiropus splendidus]|uniref:amphoterin-induced protein 1-like n=1 Tax=Synchiropus splendidus TaxID=270530 RepID=UPI00237E6939|nr:amphoterin-induced protein 1-like [Synchiropus splendidus]
MGWSLTAWSRFLRLAALLSLLPPERVAAQVLGSPLDCRNTCVCASNIVSCSRKNLSAIPTALPQYTAVLDLSYNAIARIRAEWTSVRLSRLHTLLLSHNGLTFLSSESFVCVTKLRYLDLSSNGLRILDELIFEPLEHLEVLLLYNNQISQIDRTAFSGLYSLQRLYLSQNQISRFPLELVKERSRLETLQLLDVSANKIKWLPLAELQTLPAWIRNGLYFHRNPLPCSCQLYDVVARWRLKGMSSVTDYSSDHTCVLPGAQKERMAVLDLNKIYMNCTEVSLVDEESYLDQFLVLDCDTKQRNMRKSWLLPGNIPVPPAHKTAEMLPGGHLQIGPLRAEHTGVYTCYAVSETYNETLYVNVMVYNTTMSGGMENLKTAYTTLVACLVSVVMVLVYLYLTPCACCPGQDLEKSEAEDSAHSSKASIAAAHSDMGEGEAKDFAYRHMGFPQIKDQLEQNGRLKPIGEEDEEWQEESKERRGSAGSVSSVCSDTPMVL